MTWTSVQDKKDNTPIPLSVLFKRHPPSPQALHNPGLLDVVHRVSGRSCVAPGIGWPPLAARVRTRPRDLWVPWPDRYGCTRATSTSPRTNVTPLSYPISRSPAMVWLDRKKDKTGMTCGLQHTLSISGVLQPTKNRPGRYRQPPSRHMCSTGRTCPFVAGAGSGRSPTQHACTVRPATQCRHAPINTDNTAGHHGFTAPRTHWRPGQPLAGIIRETRPI